MPSQGMKYIFTLVRYVREYQEVEGSGLHALEHR